MASEHSLSITAEYLAQCHAVGLGSTGNLAEHLRASRPGQLPHLCVNALAVRRYPGVAVFHAVIMHLESAPKKPNVFSALILVRNS